MDPVSPRFNGLDRPVAHDVERRRPHDDAERQITVTHGCSRMLLVVLRNQVRRQPGIPHGNEEETR